MQKILVIRIGRVGDMVMLTPSLSALHDLYPQAEFTLLTSADGKRVLSDFSDRIKDVWIYNRKHLVPYLIRRNMKEAITEAGFDHIYYFENNPSYYALLKGSKANVHGMLETSEVKHFCQRLLDAISAPMGKDIGYYPLTLPVKEKNLNNVDEMLAERGIQKETVVLAFHPTFSGFHSKRKVKTIGKHKLWPTDKFAHLADLLNEYAKEKDIDLRVVMNLMPDEEAIGKEIVGQSKGGQSGIETLIPKPNFKNYIAFLKRVDLLVVPDTGPMHIGAAVGTDIIALFSGKVPEDCGPFVSQEYFKVIRAEESEMPEEGISAISVEDVFQASVEQIALLQKRRVG